MRLDYSILFLTAFCNPVRSALPVVPQVITDAFPPSASDLSSAVKVHRLLRRREDLESRGIENHVDAIEAVLKNWNRDKLYRLYKRLHSQGIKENELGLWVQQNNKRIDLANEYKRFVEDIQNKPTTSAKPKYRF